MNSVYLDGTYLHKHPTWHVEDSAWKARYIIDIMTTNGLEPATVCEVGCGAGGILSCLCHQMAESVVFDGYEISPQAFDLCQDRENSRLRFHLKDLLEEEQAFFDVVLCIDVFEHVEDYLGFLRRLREKGVYKIFHIPLELTLRRVLSTSRLISSRQSYGHIHYFAKETGLATLKDAGYEIIDYFYTPCSVEVPYRTARSRLLELPRTCLFSLNQDLAVKILGGYSLMVLGR
ncbi:MAG: methylase [Planctomycetes bacterium RBG_13_60_9]|nr:MAG: methylase [Planctomycetes bacterium RBG_13_60_9]